MIRFAGYEWRIKASENAKVGPGPNYFSERGVRVDADGLHLRVQVRGGRLYCAEVVSVESFGLGAYRWQIGSDAARLDSNLVLGLFTWSDNRDDIEGGSEKDVSNHREIDIELSRWGQPDNENAQFVVQPYTIPENIVRFMLPVGSASSIHRFIWARGKVSFESATAGGFMKQHVMERHIPEAGAVNARVNVWGVKGDLAGDGVTEVLIKDFNFKAAK